MAYDNMIYDDDRIFWVKNFAEAGQAYKLLDEDTLSEDDDMMILRKDSDPFYFWDDLSYYGRPIYTHVEGYDNRRYTITEWARTTEIGIACKTFRRALNENEYFKKSKDLWILVFFDPPKADAGDIEEENVCLPGWRWVMNKGEDDKTERNVDVFKVIN